MMNETIVNWPPVYKIKKHRRAKYVKMRATKTNGLEITIPYRFSLKNIPSILEENKAWIIQQLQQIQALQNQYTDALPEQIILHAMNETWKIIYMECNSKLEMIERKPYRELVFVGKIQDKILCKKKLIAWLKAMSRFHLTTQLKTISELIQLNFLNVTIRDQETVWGSCTIDKNISLNYKLLFLPTTLVNYVLIHELCHTKHLNHSERFWKLVEKFDPLWKEHRRELRQANQFIPHWL